MGKGKIIFYRSIKSFDKVSIGEEEYIITEKIDGSNIGIGFVKGLLHIQSRYEKLEKESKKFGLNFIIEKLIEKIEKVKTILSPECSNFLIYGEMFGGDQNLKRIKYNDSEMSQIAFHTENAYFRAFDLYDVDKKTFFKYSDAISIFKRADLPFLPILNIKYDTIQELKKIVEEFPSKYTHKYVEEFPSTPEYAEGFVLKKDAIELAFSRHIFKIVRNDFIENESKNLKLLKIKKYVNKNRFLSAYSKIGDDCKKISEEMIQDALKDINLFLKDALKQEVNNYLKNYNDLLKKYVLSDDSTK